jgi:hypothetical protein
MTIKNQILIIFLTITNVFFSQRHNSKSRSEIGIMCGGSYYIGDLNPNKHFQNTNFSYGGIYRYNVHSRMSIRSNFFYGKLNASDSESDFDVFINRNLSFQSDFYEFSTGVEFNYLPYLTGHSEYRVSPYIFAQIGVFRINPKTEYNGELIELQALGTEGQQTELNDSKFYSKTQVSIPLGFGVKFSLSKNITFSSEFGIRKTFTDYIDDVSNNKFVDRNELSELNGPLVADLSNRNLDGTSQGYRGNPSTKDWYFVFGGILSIRLGPPDKCF